ncbi:TetR/AcrR family transcriptional regulator [Vagococcus intermedius]|uniref:TetR/AcrR family transcriptional regulator n=1 Tax=Vagococcus intermedius TaxID=2991418 RepID=A0AAF0I740_9ENTE|nr:TetR/AcrR family transcriptional regulator [Vagococcus intermedius]WEG73079.1 TetR/AcrR family transcriptional regulator [Vagococcus intermedius]WEG75163.1 TetR/AcrR family transcriptional regulator [Vagococcus intermedius]
MKKAELKKQRIYHATSELIDEYGGNFSLEMVAKKAEISKGGLLYYFPTKESLLAALASDIHEDFTAGVIQRAESAKVLKGRWTRALLDSLIEDMEQGMRLNVAVRANVMIDHQLIEKVRSDYSKIQNHLEHDGIDPLNGTIVRLAMQGLYHATWFDVAPLDRVDTRKVIEKLYQLIE